MEFDIKQIQKLNSESKRKKRAEQVQRDNLNFFVKKFMELSRKYLCK